jgi:hypothetical protein
MLATHRCLTNRNREKAPLARRRRLHPCAPMDAPEVVPQAAPPDLLIAELRIFLRGSSTRHRTRFADEFETGVRRKASSSPRCQRRHPYQQATGLAPSSLQSRRRASSASQMRRWMRALRTAGSSTMPETYATGGATSPSAGAPRTPVRTGAISANGAPASAQPIAFASSLVARRYFSISSARAYIVASGSPASNSVMTITRCGAALPCRDGLSASGLVERFRLKGLRHSRRSAAVRRIYIRRLASRG